MIKQTMDHPSENRDQSCTYRLQRNQFFFGTSTSTDSFLKTLDSKSLKKFEWSKGRSKTLLNSKSLKAIIEILECFQSIIRLIFINSYGISLITRPNTCSSSLNILCTDGLKPKYDHVWPKKCMYN